MAAPGRSASGLSSPLEGSLAARSSDDASQVGTEPDWERDMSADNVKVMIRIRPSNEREQTSGANKLYLQLLRPGCLMVLLSKGPAWMVLQNTGLILLWTGCTSSARPQDVLTKPARPDHRSLQGSAWPARASGHGNVAWLLHCLCCQRAAAYRPGSHPLLLCSTGWACRSSMCPLPSVLA